MPNGGYVAAQFNAVALAHVAEHGHNNVISSHWDFLGRSEPGRATFVVDEAKIARNMSVVYISMYQDGQLTEAPWVSSNARRVIVGSITCRDISAESGLSLEYGIKSEKPPPAVDFELLSSGQDPDWAALPTWATRSSRVWNMYGQRHGPVKEPLRDMWVKYHHGGKITDIDLPYVVDITPAVCMHVGINGPKPLAANKFWYPTLNIHMDYKKSLPAEGAEWLRVRTTFKTIKNGRFDCDVDVLDAAGELVAQARHMAMVVDMSRNTAARKPSNL